MILDVFKKGTQNRATPQLDRILNLLVAQGKPSYSEMVEDGVVFSGGVTGAGVAPGTAIGTGAGFTLFNPASSKKKLVMLKASAGYISGTLGAGTVFYAGNVNPIAAAVTGTALVVVNNKLGSNAVDRGNHGSLFVSATLPASPTILRPFCNLTALLATTAVSLYQLIDNLDGEFELLPGTALSLEAVAAAGTAPLVTFGFTWAELPLEG